MSIAEGAVSNKTHLLLNDPAALAGHSAHAWDHLARSDIDAMQRLGLQQRFAALRDEIPMLRRLADAESITAIEEVDDAAPLLFRHTVYKSYPASLLEQRNFRQINLWLGKLVRRDLAEAMAAVDVSACRSLDAWFETMDRAIPQLTLSHTSGTSGTISFLPHGTREWEKVQAVRRLHVWNMAGPQTPAPELYVAYPYYRSGFISHLRVNEHVIRQLLKDESHFRAAYPQRLSSDLLHLSARIRAAHARGTLDRLDISPDLRRKKADFDRLQADMPAHLAAFFARIVDEIRGKRVYLLTTWTNLHSMAKAGLSRGLEGVFSPDSFIVTSGGAKGMSQPDGWRDEVLRFTGVKRLVEGYSMSEVAGSHFTCEHGHFHLAHTIIPFLLDPDSGRPLPRRGRQTGRAAFFDLGAEIRWGGFVTGDEITIEWDAPCPCGRPSRYIVGPIQRYSDKSGDDDKITCAATEASIHEAMHFLNGMEG